MSFAWDCAVIGLRCLLRGRARTAAYKQKPVSGYWPPATITFSVRFLQLPRSVSIISLRSVPILAACLQMVLFPPTLLDRGRVLPYGPMQTRSVLRKAGIR